MVSVPKAVPNLKHRSASTDCPPEVCGSWDASIRNLSDSLSQICSSPTQSHHHSFHDFMKNRSNNNRGSSNGCKTPNNSPNSQNLSISPTEKLSQAVFLQSGRKCKRVRVRHEESKRKLHEQLVAICGSPNGSQDSLSSNSGDLPQRPLNSNHRPDIKRDVTKRFRIQFNLNDVSPEQLSIQFADSLSLYSCQNDTHEQISAGKIPDDVDVETVMCLIDEGELDIMQYPQKYLKMDYPERTANYLPIMQQDDLAGTWRMIVHVPGCYDTVNQAITVKTVDDRLCISWHRYSNTDSNTEGLCKMSVDLPYNVITRTVSGAVSEDNQLIVEARLGRKRDRCLTL